MAPTIVPTDDEEDPDILEVLSGPSPGADNVVVASVGSVVGMISVVVEVKVGVGVK